MAEVLPMNQGNMNEMRAILWDAIEGIKMGKSSPSQVNAISNACGKWLGTVKMELEAAKIMGRKPQILALMAPEPEATPATT